LFAAARTIAIGDDGHLSRIGAHAVRLRNVLRLPPLETLHLAAFPCVLLDAVPRRAADTKLKGRHCGLPRQHRNLENENRNARGGDGKKTFRDPYDDLGVVHVCLLR